MNIEFQSLLENCNDIDEADNYIVKYTGYKETKLKLAFFRGLFPINILYGSNGENCTDDQSEQADYDALLTTIINRRNR